MNLANDISQYVASVKMSSKTRVLVEGKDDKSHLENLINITIGGKKIKVDTVEAIKGDCGSTRKNNKEKINKIYRLCQPEKMYKNIYFLRDREFDHFIISNYFQDNIGGRTHSEKIHYTIGHSFENYFINESIIENAFLYLTPSEYKFDAISLFLDIMPTLVRVISSLTLAARDRGVCSYPMGVVKWTDFNIESEELLFDIKSCGYKNDDTIKEGFQSSYNTYLELALSSDIDVCIKISRGHTAIVMLQRAFAACIFHVAESGEKLVAQKHASDFAGLKERQVTSALCQSWLNFINQGNVSYPASLLSSLSAE